jgi:general secretion pathway protein H
MTTPPGRRGGFTLLEVLIVLAVMGAVAGLVLPFAGGGLDSMRVAAGARGVVSFLNEARNRAIAEAAPLEVSFDAEEGLLVRRRAGVEGAEAEARYRLPGSLTVSRMGKANGNEGVYDSIIFYPLGDSTGGTVELKDAADRRWTVTVGVLFAAPKLTSRVSG